MPPVNQPPVKQQATTLDQTHPDRQATNADFAAVQVDLGNFKTGAEAIAQKQEAVQFEMRELLNKNPNLDVKNLQNAINGLVDTHTTMRGAVDNIVGQLNYDGRPLGPDGRPVLDGRIGPDGRVIGAGPIGGDGRPIPVGTVVSDGTQVGTEGRRTGPGGRPLGADGRPL